MKDSLNKINMAILSITIKNPFVGSILMRMDFIESKKIDKVYLGEKTLIYYNANYIELFDRESLKYLLYFIFFIHLNRLQVKINNQADEGVDLGVLHIAMESCLNSYLKSIKIAEFDVSSINPYYSYNSKVVDFDYEEYHTLLASGVFAIREDCDLLVDIVSNPDIDSENSTQDIDKDFSSLVRDYIEDMDLSADGLAAGLGGFAPSSFFKSEDLVRFSRYQDRNYVNWKEVVKGAVIGHQKTNYQLMPNQRLNFGNRIIPVMPQRVPTEAIDLAVAVDVSFSISQKVVKKFINEIFKIVSIYNNYSIKFWTFSTVVNEESYSEFDSQDNEIDDDYVFEINIGGGTVFEENWSFMNNRKIKPNLFIVFTDGQPNYGWGDPDYCDTIFIVFDPSNIFNLVDAPDFGKTIVVNDI